MKWTPAQIAFLEEHYTTKGDTELAQLFNEKWGGFTKKVIELI